MLNRTGLIGLFLLFALACGRVGMAEEGSLALTVEPVGGDLLEVTLTNVTDRHVSFLKWDTPFEDVISADLFSVYPATGSPEKKLDYKGRLVKRAGVDASQYLTLSAGESIQSVIPLSMYYEIPGRGRYTATFTGSFHVETYESISARQISASNKGSAIDPHQILSSESVTVELTPLFGSRAVLPANFNSCTAQQQSELNAALQASEVIALGAFRGLSELQGDARLNSPRYKYWFGDYSAARFAKVLSTFDATANVLSSSTIEFDCSCADSSLYAYVFRNRPYRIYPCPNFWASSLNGTDSRSGTIVHELTHFTAVSNTDDHQYGQIGASGLAVSDPDLAVVNADSYEYFAENSPEIETLNPVVFTEIGIANAESGQLSGGQSSYYKIKGVDLIELSSITGDADLYVYKSVALDEIVCRSLTQNVLDSCSPDPLATAYIEVRGYTDTEFSLVASLQNPDAVVANKPEPSSEPVPFSQIIAVATQSYSVGGNSGEAPTNDQGGGAPGWYLFFLLMIRRIVLFAPDLKSRAPR